LFVVVNQIGLSRYALVAHDSGGVIARLVAAADERVAGLVLADSEIPGHHPPLLAAFVIGARWWPSLLTTILSSPRLRRSALGFGTCFTDPRYVDGDFCDLFVRLMLESQELARSQLQLLKTLDMRLVDGLSDVHRKIRAPVRLIWGENDPFFPISKARRMISAFAGGADIHEIPRAKLYSHEDHADEFAAAARPFLLDVLGERSRSAARPTIAIAGAEQP
jgi:haloalkane dehalogenase